MVEGLVLEHIFCFENILWALVLPLCFIISNEMGEHVFIAVLP